MQASADRSNAITCGHRACQGCGEALGARYAMDAAMRATGGNVIAVNTTGCLEVFTTPYPETSWQMPWLHSLFGNAAAVATGVAAAMRVKGRNEVRALAQGGDGGTTDIGFGCLSGMFERNDDVLYVCYDNEAYMNTGIQRSSATPAAARTATTATSAPFVGGEWFLLTGSGGAANQTDPEALAAIGTSQQVCHWGREGSGIGAGILCADGNGLLLGFGIEAVSGMAGSTSRATLMSDLYGWAGGLLQGVTNPPAALPIP